MSIFDSLRPSDRPVAGRSGRTRKLHRVVVGVLLTVALLGGMRTLATRSSNTVTTGDGGGLQTRAPSPTANRRYVDNMPTGFERTETGVRDAGIAFAGDVEQQMLYLDDPSIERAQRQISSAARAEELLVDRHQRVTQWREVLKAGQGQLWWVVTPLAVRVGTFTPDRAQVSVWVSFVVSRSGVVAPKVWFGVLTTDLVWERDDWRVWSQSLVDGPTPSPSPGAKPSDAGELGTRLDHYELVSGGSS